MATDDFSTGGMSLFGYIIAFVIIVWVISAITGGAGFGLGFGNRGYGAPYGDYQTLKEIFESQKADISQTATTQYMIGNQAEQTRDYLGTKIDFYAFQDLRDKLNDAKNENLALRNQMFTKDQFALVNERINNINCNMLRKPDVTGIGVSCPSAAILNGLGVNYLNQCGNCNNGTLL